MEKSTHVPDLKVSILNHTTLPTRGLSHLAKELTAATRIMQSSSDELLHSGIQ